MSAVNLRNVLVLLGIVLTTIGIVYFATEFSDVISNWGRVLDLALFAVLFVALGVHFDAQGDDEVIAAHGWRWLRVTNALYILGAIATFGAAIAFFATDLDRIWKVLIVILVGLGLILGAAGVMQRRARQP
ncbi:MAG: hypothetical protein QOE90_1369 [Thermoplasmata archaeon]|jgi:hypothetical protein|nr:hypothetical protein [Thermoplasmata archaeon]